MLRVRVTATAIFAAFALGCAAEEAALEPDQALGSVFDFTNRPAAAGPFVMRRADQFVWVGIDPARGLLSINGLGTIDPASSVFCTGTGSLDVWSLQEVVLELGGDAPTVRGLLLGRENTQHVYGDVLAFLSEPDMCAAVQLPRLAQGRGNFRVTDNDLFGGGPGGNSFGWAAEGILDDLVNGGQVHYTEEQRAVWLPDGTFKGFVMENILLNPIGN